jgi:hypothetical protein
VGGAGHVDGRDAPGGRGARRDGEATAGVPAFALAVSQSGKGRG